MRRSSKVERRGPALPWAFGCAATLSLLATPALADEERADFTAQGQVASGEVTAAPASAPPVAREFDGQRSFGLVGTAGGEGLGLGLRGGAPRLGLEVTGSWTPILATYSPNSRDVSFEFFSTFQLNTSAYFSFYRSSPRTDMGIAAMYQYNTLLHHGAGLAFYAQYDLSHKWALHFTAGLVIFPKAQELLRATGRFEPGGSINSGISAARGGVAVSLAFFP